MILETFAKGIRNMQLLLFVEHPTCRQKCSTSGKDSTCLTDTTVQPERKLLLFALPNVPNYLLSALHEPTGSC